MILFANALLGVPLVKLLGAWLLIVIALNGRAQKGAAEAAPAVGGAGDFLSAAAVIMAADATMSLDNVVALAAIAGGNLWLLTIGILLSIPILISGALILSRLLRLAPEIFAVGAAFLGWIAGGMATTDPLVSGWIDANAPALAVFGPALGALFVLAAGKGAPRPAAEAPQPAARPTRSRAPKAPAAATPQDSLPSPSATAADTTSRPADDRQPAFASNDAAAPGAGWNEERLVVAGFVLLAFLAGLIIFVASFFDSLT
jgi:hypothetical protein